MASASVRVSHAGLIVEPGCALPDGVDLERLARLGVLNDETEPVKRRSRKTAATSAEDTPAE